MTSDTMAVRTLERLQGYGHGQEWDIFEVDQQKGLGKSKIVHINSPVGGCLVKEKFCV